MRQVDSLGMTMSYREKRRKEAAAIHLKIDPADWRMSNESPLLPSPNTPQIPVIPNESTLHTFRKAMVL
jgi:hypothetical protein